MVRFLFFVYCLIEWYNRMKLIRDRHETDIEQLFREDLESRGFVKGKDFATEYPLRNSFIIDVAFPEQKIAVELDGEPWHTKPKARKRDNFKNYILKKNGWRVMRFWGNDIRKDVAACVDLVLKQL